MGQAHNPHLPRLSKDELRELSALNPIRSSFQIIVEWLTIVLAIWLCSHHWSPYLFVAVAVSIGARQHALLILMHEATHYRLCKSKRLNDSVGELLLAWPFFVTLRAYRRNHIAHHKHMNTAQDPDLVRKLDDPNWQFPKRGTEIAAMLLSDLLGLNTIALIRLSRTFAAGEEPPPRSYILSRAGFYLIALALLIGTGTLHLFLLYWVVPYFTWLAMVLHLRSIAEHFAIPENNGLPAGLRTTRTGLIERLLIAPNNVGYHAEHHLFPGVPFYRLPKLHRLLEPKTEFRDIAHISNGYRGVLSECLPCDRASKPAPGVFGKAFLERGLFPRRLKPQW
ncbi:MAG: fatty acid desaturase family protein [Candidatus Binataceae bacterium]|nr:fatty acid desaturase family protein [Candidatus Binataceae bacterium]